MLKDEDQEKFNKQFSLQKKKKINVSDLPNLFEKTKTEIQSLKS
jgi:hypothetical protein